MCNQCCPIWKVSWWIWEGDGAIKEAVAKEVEKMEEDARACDLCVVLILAFHFNSVADNKSSLT